MSEVPKTRKLEPARELLERRRPYFAEHEEGGEFFNPWGATAKPSPVDLLKWQLGKNPHRQKKRREKPLLPIEDPLARFDRPFSSLRMMWLGHASFLVEMDGVRVLIDPVFGTVGWVVPRKSPEPVTLASLPPVDAVLITHGHYDHLDIPTLRRLAEKTPGLVIALPRGLGRYVPKMGERRLELDWWEAFEIGPVEACLVPTQHWHRRGLLDHNRALWGGWVLRGDRIVYHSGDTGYDRGLFQTLGEFFEPIDYALLPIGAYEPKWFMAPQHMSPAESLRAFQELAARQFVAMHWGTYDLTDEPLKEGAEELRKLIAAGDLEADRFSTLLPGESIHD